MSEDQERYSDEMTNHKLVDDETHEKAAFRPSCKSQNLLPLRLSYFVQKKRKHQTKEKKYKLRLHGQKYKGLKQVNKEVYFVTKKRKKNPSSCMFP